MKKSTAIKIFGGRQHDLAAALGVTREAITQWPDDLPDKHSDRVVGAALRSGKPVADLPVRYTRNIGIA